MLFKFLLVYYFDGSFLVRKQVLRLDNFSKCAYNKKKKLLIEVQIYDKAKEFRSLTSTNHIINFVKVVNGIRFLDAHEIFDVYHLLRAFGSIEVPRTTHFLLFSRAWLNSIVNR